MGQGAVLRLDQGREANASVDSLLPGFAVEAHLERLFEDEEVHETEGGTLRPSLSAALRALPTADNQELRTKNAAKSDWICREVRQERASKGAYRKRTSDRRGSGTDPDATAMTRSKKGTTRVSYQTHYVVEGGKARAILGVLVTPSEVTENRLMRAVWGPPAPSGRGSRHPAGPSFCLPRR